MKNKVKRILPKSEFSRNVLTLMTGTTIAQIIPIIASFILSRIYSPREFGSLALFISSVSIMGSLSSLTYETTIILPNKNYKAKLLAELSFYLTIIFTLTVTFIIFIIPENLLLNIDKSISNWVFLVPLAILIFGFYQILMFYSNRFCAYRNISLSRVLQSSINAILSILLGLIGFTYIGLILGFIIGLFFALLFLFKGIKWRIKPLTRNYYSNLIKVAKEYIIFPKFSTFSTLFNSLSNIGLPIIITLFFGTTISGLYFFSSKIIRFPLNFVIVSFSQVFRQRAANLFYSDKKGLLKFIKKVQLKIFVYVFPILIIVSFIGPLIFKIAFGEEWEESGLIIRYFAIFILFNSLYSPISAIGDILKQQRFLLFFNVSLSLSQILILYFLSKFTEFNMAILASSVIGSIHFIYIDYYMKRKLKEIIYEESS